MAETLALEIVTPEGVKLTQSVEIFTAPGVNGEFGVMPRHRPMLAALTAGIVTFTRAGVLEAVAIGPGFAEVADDHAVVLTDHFTTKADIDPVRVRLELKEVDEALDHFAGDPKSPEYGAPRRARALGCDAARALRRPAAAPHPHAKRARAEPNRNVPRPRFGHGTRRRRLLSGVHFGRGTRRHRAPIDLHSSAGASVAGVTAKARSSSRWPSSATRMRHGPGRSPG